MLLSAINTDSQGNAITALTNPDLIRELKEFLAEVYFRPIEDSDENYCEPLKSHH